MPERGGNAGDTMSRTGGRETLEELGDTKRRQRGATAQRKEFSHRTGGRRKDGLYAAFLVLLLGEKRRAAPPPLSFRGERSESRAQRGNCFSASTEEPAFAK